MKITKQRVTQLRQILEQQHLKDDKLSKALRGVIQWPHAPTIDYVDIIKVIRLVNPKVWDEFYYNWYECHKEAKVELENKKVVKVKPRDLDSLLNVLEALDLLEDEDIR